MEWAEDLFTLKRSAKKGRRAAAAEEAVNVPPVKPNKPSSGLSIDVLTDSFEDEIDLNSVPKPKKTGGWADEPIKSGKSKTGPTSNIIEQERFHHSILSHHSEDDIPLIPDIDDIQDEKIVNNPNEAPEITVNRVATYTELNSDLLKRGAFATLDEIDLSILARCLLNERDLVEPDEVWTWDQLFTEVSGEIHAEKPKSTDDPSKTVLPFVH